jgi:uncharacterized membrane protein YfcA
LTWRGHPMNKAVGVSASIGIPIALAGTVSYIYNGLDQSDLPEHSVGFVYLPALIGVVLTSVFFARLGAKISKSLPQDKMRKTFAVFLMLVALKIFID